MLIVKSCFIINEKIVSNGLFLKQFSSNMKDSQQISMFLSARNPLKQHEHNLRSDEWIKTVSNGQPLKMSEFIIISLSVWISICDNEWQFDIKFGLNRIESDINLIKCQKKFGCNLKHLGHLHNLHN